MIGGTLDSLFYALHNGYPLVYSSARVPPFYEKDETRDWASAYFYLSLAGLLPFTDTCKSIRYVDKNSISVMTEKKRYEVAFENLHVFDDFQGLPSPISTTTSQVRVFDYMSIRTLLGIDVSMVVVPPGKLHFYQSNRASRHDLKDACLVRVVDSVLLSEEENSELYSRFLVEEELAKMCNKNVLVESLRREVVSLGRGIYAQMENINFIYDTTPRTFKSNDNYLRYLVECMNE